MKPTRDDPVYRRCAEEAAALPCRSAPGRWRLPVLHGDSPVHPERPALRTRILHECHDAPTGGHLGKDKTIEQVKRRFYWPGMDDDVRAYVTSCDACQRNKPSSRPRWA